MLSKSKIIQSFAAASTTYDSVALLQRNVGINLLQRMGTINQTDTIVDLGCGTGFLANALLEQETTTGQIIALDIAFPMLQQARNKLPNNNTILYLCADAEWLPIQPNTVDWVISNLAFQWCNLEMVFCEVRRILKPEGNFYFTTFGVNTLCELKKAWQEVDNYQHVNAFYSTTQLSNLLQHAGFQVVESDNKPYVSIYESVWDLMSELKQLGAHTVIEGSSKHLMTKTKMQRMICAYQKQDVNGLIPATFDVITTSAKA